MDEDISIINSNTRNEKIKNFFVENKKVLFSIMGFIHMLDFLSIKEITIVLLMKFLIKKDH